MDFFAFLVSCGYAVQKELNMQLMEMDARWESGGASARKMGRSCRAYWYVYHRS